MGADHVDLAFSMREMMKNVGKTTGKHILLFRNPSAGARSRETVIRDFAAELESRQYQIEMISDPAALTDSVARLCQTGDLRMVLSAGGDGTVRLVVNQTPPETPIMMLPMGTENLLAKYLGISSDPAKWLEIVEHGEIVRWDTGRVIDGDESHIFLLMLSCGFDADVVRRLDEGRSGNIHHLSYVKPIWDSLRNYEYPELRIQYCTEEGQPWTDHFAHWAFLFNIPTYAGGLRIAPVADPADGMLDLCTFVGGSIPRGLFHLATVLLRQQGDWSNFSRIQARRFRITSQQEVPYQIDGDSGGFLPVELEVGSRKVTLVTPPDFRPNVS